MSEQNPVVKEAVSHALFQRRYPGEQSSINQFGSYNGSQPRDLPARGKTRSNRIINLSEILANRHYDPPDPVDLGAMIFKFCSDERVRLVLLDGPQGWKTPQTD